MESPSRMFHSFIFCQKGIFFTGKAFHFDLSARPLGQSGLQAHCLLVRQIEGVDGVRDGPDTPMYYGRCLTTTEAHRMMKSLPSEQMAQHIWLSDTGLSLPSSPYSSTSMSRCVLGTPILYHHASDDDDSSSDEDSIPWMYELDRPYYEDLDSDDENQNLPQLTTFAANVHPSISGQSISSSGAAAGPSHDEVRPIINRQAYSGIGGGQSQDEIHPISSRHAYPVISVPSDYSLPSLDNGTGYGQHSGDNAGLSRLDATFPPTDKQDNDKIIQAWLASTEQRSPVISRSVHDSSNVKRGIKRKAPVCCESPKNERPIAVVRPYMEAKRRRV